MTGAGDRADPNCHILLLTGPPGIGKTTVVRRVASRLDPAIIRGFTTEEIRAGGGRLGFCLETFDGQSIVLAHVDHPSRSRVGKYGVDLAAFEAVVDELFGRPVPPALYLIDEIGRMECLSQRFVSAVSAVLDGGLPVVATIAARGEGFIARVKARRDAELRQVTRANRDALPGEILEWLRARGAV
jgi:nucleoside-triphosphatase